MRSVLAALGIGIVLAGAASAAKAPVRLLPVRGNPVATVRWSATVAVAGSRRPAVLVARSGITRLTVPFARSGRHRFRARPTFPFAGSWRLDARIGARLYRLGSVNVRPAPPVASLIPGATATRICSGTGEPYPQYVLAREGDRLWVACRTPRRLDRVDASTGNVNAQLRLGSNEPNSIAAGDGSVWWVSRSPSVSRINTRTGALVSDPLQSESSYLWFAAGSVWAAEDGTSTLARIAPSTRTVTARIPTGNGTSALVTEGGSAWIVNHRDGTLDRIDLATNAIQRLGRLPGDAPERMVLAGGSLWLTGRGTDLLRVDPATGNVQATVEVGAGAIDVTAAGHSIWVFAPTADDDRRGVPFVERVLRVNPATNAIVQTIRTTGRVVLNGLTSDGSAVWLADTLGGRLYRLPAS